MKLTKSKLEQIIREEIANALGEKKRKKLGFGEGTPPDNEWGKKQVIALEEEEEAKDNPWAICTASVGRDDKEKYESCVQSVKKEKGIK